MRDNTASAGGLIAVIDGRVEHGQLLRVNWCGGCSWHVEWNDASFVLAEVLRDQYDPMRIVKLKWRAIPDTEAEYSVAADVLVKAPFRPQPVRNRLGRHPLLKNLRKAVPTSGGFEIENLLDSDFTGLDEADRKLYESFARLPLRRKISFWQKHLAPFFRKAGA